MTLHVYLLCHNEEVLLPHTVAHYRRRVPGVTFTILDNESDDRSVAVARELGCAVVAFGSHGKLDDDTLRDLKNTVWREVADGWVIMADMDEWLCVTAVDLEREERLGVTVLNTEGWDVFGESATTTLDDIDLHTLRTGYLQPPESKAICFRRPHIAAMNYDYGAHVCAPDGEVTWSRRTYRLKHMAWLGHAFIVRKYQLRYERGLEQRARGLAIHYTDDVAEVSAQFAQARAAARAFSESSFRTTPVWQQALMRHVRRVPSGELRRLRRLFT